MTKVLDLASPAEITAHSYHIGMSKRVGRKDGQMKREAVGRLYAIGAPPAALFIHILASHKILQFFIISNITLFSAVCYA